VDQSNGVRNQWSILRSQHWRKQFGGQDRQAQSGSHLFAQRRGFPLLALDAKCRAVQSHLFRLLTKRINHCVVKGIVPGHEDAALHLHHAAQSPGEAVARVQQATDIVALQSG
jgi:hypothetical protein